MNGLEDIVTEAVSAVAGDARKADVSAVASAGKAVVSWIKQRFASRRALVESVDKVVANPGSVAATKILEGHLYEALEENPRLRDELRDILKQAGVSYGNQTAYAKGKGNKIAQTQGDNNSVKMWGEGHTTVSGGLDRPAHRMAQTRKDGAIRFGVDCVTAANHEI